MDPEDDFLSSHPLFPPEASSASASTSATPEPRPHRLPEPSPQLGGRFRFHPNTYLPTFSLNGSHQTIGEEEEGPVTLEKAPPPTVPMAPSEDDGSEAATPTEE